MQLEFFQYLLTINVTVFKRIYYSLHCLTIWTEIFVFCHRQVQYNYLRNKI